MLYHYTSINSLVQILENKSFMFNNLTACDDLEEAESKDLGRIGKFVFISSWTDIEKESIPMWSQYSGNMSGVRIGMQEYPFKIRRYNNEEKGAPFESFLNLKKYYNENKMTFTGDQPLMLKVEYVEDNDKIQPQILTEGTDKDIEKFFRCEPSKFTLSFDAVGKYKRTCWEFQSEVRYKIFGTPVGIKEKENIPAEQMLKMQRETLRRVLDVSYTPPYSALYLDLDEAAINNMEIVFGPRMNAAEKILLKTFLNSKGLEKNYRDSSLKIQ